MVLTALVWTGFAGAVAWLVMIWWSERAQRKRSNRAVKACLDEDVSALDEDLWRLGRDLADTEYDGDARRDYERAVAINDAIRRSVDQLRSVILADAMTGALTEARYAMACVRARLAGETVPERRLPCFFNPRHGPSVADVSWPSPPDEPLDVPACAADAARIDVAEEPDGLQIWTGSKRVPYWEASAAFYAYASGYFTGDWVGAEEGPLEALKTHMRGGASGLATPLWGIEGAGGVGGGC